jgi:hypothetical protein
LGLKLILERDPSKLGKMQEWSARFEGQGATGFGKSRMHAIDSLVRSNLGLLQIEEWVDKDPLSPTPETGWSAGKFTPRGEA